MMFPLGVVGGLQEITSVKSSGEFACKSLTGPDTAGHVVKCYVIHYPCIISPRSQTLSHFIR